MQGTVLMEYLAKSYHHLFFKSQVLLEGDA